MEGKVKEETIIFYLVHIWGFDMVVMVDILLVFALFSTNLATFVIFNNYFCFLIILSLFYLCKFWTTRVCLLINLFVYCFIECFWFSKDTTLIFQRKKLLSLKLQWIIRRIEKTGIKHGVVCVVSLVTNCICNDNQW